MSKETVMSNQIRQLCVLVVLVSVLLATGLVAQPGTWVEETTAAEWSGRHGFGTTVFDGRVWVIGGEDGQDRMNDVWSSSDGVHWVQETPDAGWSPRASFATVVFDDRLWVIGGFDGDPKNDVWSSSDGVDWVQETPDADWSPRSNLGAGVLDDKLWVIGGSDGDLRNDVWSSSDGVDWVQETPNAGWSPRDSFRTAVFDSRLWVMGGWYPVDVPPYEIFKNDVWSSSDGIHWVEETSVADWSARYLHEVAVLHGRLWVMGGFDDSVSGADSMKTDVWSSPDGIDWHQESPAAGWSFRIGFGATAFNDSLWVMGGYWPSVTPYMNDVWSYSPDPFPPESGGGDDTGGCTIRTQQVDLTLWWLACAGTLLLALRVAGRAKNTRQAD